MTPSTDKAQAGHKKHSLKSKLICFIIGLVFIAIGALIFTKAFLTPYRESKIAENWKRVDARVTSCQVERNSKSTILTIKYQYVYKDDQYSGDRFGLAGDNNISKSTIPSISEQYAKGKKISIWVNPSAPHQSLCKRNLPFGKWAILPISLLLLLLGLLFFASTFLANWGEKIAHQHRQKSAKVAKQRGASEIYAALTDPDFEDQTLKTLSFLKHDKLYEAACFFIFAVMANIFMSIFVICNIGIYLSANKPDDYIRPIIMSAIVAVLSFKSLRLFFKSIAAFINRKGEDHVILSISDETYTTFTHHWLLLSDQADYMELSLLTVTHENPKSLKKILKTTPILDTFKTPDKAVIRGSLTHSLATPPKKELTLVAFTKNTTQSRMNRHMLTLRTPDEDND